MSILSCPNLSTFLALPLQFLSLSFILFVGGHLISPMTPNLLDYFSILANSCFDIWSGNFELIDRAEANTNLNLTIDL